MSTQTQVTSVDRIRRLLDQAVELARSVDKTSVDATTIIEAFNRSQTAALSYFCDAKTMMMKADADIPEHLNTPEFNEAWCSWWESRKKRKMSVSPIIKKRQLKQLAVGDADQATAIVSKAEENGWQGIPDNVWIPKYGEGLWCGRMPLNASEELKKRISAALPIGTNRYEEKVDGPRGPSTNITTADAAKRAQAGQKVVAPLQVDRSAWGARNKPGLEKLSLEEQRKAMLRRK